jgi:hypothetical protein
VSGYVVAAGFVVWVVAVVVAFGKALWYGTEGPVKKAVLWGAALFLLVVIPLGVMFERAAQTRAAGPCLRYETGTHFNAATRTMMPYRRCVERGEWIE